VLETEFAPAERSTIEIVKKQSEIVKRQQMALSLLDSVPIPVTILNINRQIVYSNKSFNDYMDTIGRYDFVGQRPGEALNCVHAFEKNGGCGTSEFCSTCGAVHAILLSQDFEKGIQECRITMQNQDALELMIWANPIEIEDEFFTIFAVADIADEKRRKALERIFFHDILNTAGGLKGFIGLLTEADEDEMDEYLDITSNLTEKLIDEIKAQKLLSVAENNELEINLQHFATVEMLQEIKLLYQRHEVTKGRIIEIDSDAFDKVVESDKTIMRRILGNLTKNALEAIDPGEIVKLGCNLVGESYEFYVHNPVFIPREIQLQLFQRSFSTKGIGRGLGTYSVKLLTERYLKGSVSFISTQEEGTTFKVRFSL